VGKVLDRPLGGYVVTAWMFNIPVGICAALALANGRISGCVDKSVFWFCVANVVLAIVHCGFAIYLQTRLVALLAHMSDGREATSQDLMKRAGDIVLYDFGFCIYIFVFLGSFFFQFVGLSWGRECDAGALPILAGVLLILFAFAAGFFFTIWLATLACVNCCQQCFGNLMLKVVLGRDISQRRPPAPAVLIGQAVTTGAVPPQRPYQAVPPGHPGPSAAQAMYGVPASSTASTPQTQQALDGAIAAAGIGIGLAGAGLQAAAGWLKEKGEQRRSQQGSAAGSSSSSQHASGHQS